MGTGHHAATAEAHRTELEMQHWVAAVTSGLRRRARGERCLEVRKDDLCSVPLPHFEKIFTFPEIPFLPKTRDWLAKIVHRTRGPASGAMLQERRSRRPWPSARSSSGASDLLERTRCAAATHRFRPPARMPKSVPPPHIKKPAP